jgi:hypothetical protein
MAAVAVAATALDCRHQESEPAGCATQRRPHHDVGVAELVQDAGNSRANRLLHALHQGVSIGEFKESSVIGSRLCAH